MRDGVAAIKELYDTLFKYPTGEAPFEKTPALKLSQGLIKSFQDTGLKECPPIFEGGEPYYKKYTGKSRT